MNKTFYGRLAPWILLATAALFPLIIVGVQRAMSSNNNDVRQWLPEGFAETRRYDWFLEHFGSEEMAVVSWPGCTLDDPRLARLAAELAPLTESRSSSAGGKAPQALFHRVITGPQLLAELTSEPLSLSYDEALRRLNGSLIGPDGATTALLAMVNDAGAADRHAALDAIGRAAVAAGLDPAELRLGGPTVESVALDSESERSRYKLAAFSVLIAVGLAWRCLRRVRLVAIVFAVALLCTGISVAMIYYTGERMSLLLITMPTLIFVLAISGAIHLTNYYRDALAKHGPQGATERAVAAGFWPCTLTGLTTAAGLGSLGVSEVIPVMNFGLYSALGVVLSLPVLFLVLPSALQLFSLRWDAKAAEPQRAAPKAADGQHWSYGVSSVLTRYNVWIAAGCLGVAVLAGAGLFRLTTSVKLLSLFSPQARIIQDYTWLEKHLGPIVPIEIVLRFDHDHPLSMLERLELVNDVQGRLDQMNMVGGTMSAATFAPSLPEGGGARQIVRRRLVEKALTRSQEELVDARYLNNSEDGQLWRLSARVEAMNSLDYGYFIDRVREQVEPALAAAAIEGRPNIEATYTGLVPLVYKAQNELLNDLIKSFLSAFVLVAAVMVVMLRGLRAGMVSMLPNIFPAVVIFGAMGWMGRLCDIGAMMTASVALGIAVDDTIHFLSWFRRGIQQGLPRREAIRMAYENCALAMVQTTIVCGFGVLVFGLSGFVPTASFATLMFVLLVTALVGDLIFLPAILSSPLGKFFESTPTAGKASWLSGLKLRRLRRPAVSPAPVLAKAVAKPVA